MTPKQLRSTSIEGLARYRSVVHIFAFAVLVALLVGYNMSCDRNSMTWERNGGVFGSVSRQPGTGVVELTSLDISDYRTATPALDAFHSIQLDIPATVYITQGTPQQVTIMADQFNMPYVGTNVSDGVLTIREPYGMYSYFNGLPTVVCITMAEVCELAATDGGALVSRGVCVADSIVLRGGGVFYMTIEVDKLLTIGDAGGRFYLKGLTTVHEASLTQGALLQAFELHTDTTILEVPSGIALVNAYSSLDVSWNPELFWDDVYGQPIVAYRGSPIITGDFIDWVIEANHWECTEWDRIRGKCY